MRRCCWCARPFNALAGELFCSNECARSEKNARARDERDLRRVMDARLAKATGRAK